MHLQTSSRTRATCVRIFRISPLICRPSDLVASNIFSGVAAHRYDAQQFKELFAFVVDSGNEALATGFHGVHGHRHILERKRP